MVKLNKKRRILLMYQNGDSKAEIAREVNSSRKTVRKYINEYEDKVQKLVGDKNLNQDDLEILIEELSSEPKYDSSNRKRIKLTDEVKDLIDQCLDKNAEKIKNHERKAAMKAIDIHEFLVDEKGIEIGYTTVCNYVSTMKKAKEAFIRQEYQLGNTLEYDWGVVALEIAGVKKKYQIAVMTTAKGSCHFARLYENQKMESFLDSHVRGLKYFGGVHKEIVYDNMKVAVKRFVSITEKEITDDLMKMSMYYGFDTRLCNIRSGNEKGHVEKGVEYIRRKAFSAKREFASLEEANKHLEKRLVNLNDRKKKWLENRSPWEVLVEERQYMNTLKPDYVISREAECRVDKYSTITIEQNRYSVPEYLVGKFVEAKISVDRVKVLYKDELVATHDRKYGTHEWTMDIYHYLNTIKKKPGSLKNSAAMQCLDHRIQNIYKKYYTKKPKEFVVLLEIIKKKSFEDVDNVIKELEKLGSRHVTTENVRNLVNQREPVLEENIKSNEDEIKIKSVEMLDKLTYAFLQPSPNGGVLN
jgi:transposase